jgi:hypothetical protein
MDINMNDDDLNLLLNQASTPIAKRDPIANFFEKSSNVIAFPQRKKTSPWLIGLPLAASLILGVWLGSATNFAATAAGEVVVAEDSAATSLDDLMSLIESDV